MGHEPGKLPRPPTQLHHVQATDCRDAYNWHRGCYDQDQTEASIRDFPGRTSAWSTPAELHSWTPHPGHPPTYLPAASVLLLNHLQNQLLSHLHVTAGGRST